MRFNFPNEHVIEWNGRNSIPRGRIISCLKAGKMISKGCLYHIIRVQDLDSKIPPIESVPVVNEFSEVFPSDPGIPTEWEIVFGIDFLPETNPISIPPYRMAPAELIELKSQLKDLHDKDFIRPSISPWCFLVLFLEKNNGSWRMCINFRQLNIATISNK